MIEKWTNLKQCAQANWIFDNIHWSVSSRKSFCYDKNIWEAMASLIPRNLHFQTQLFVEIIILRNKKISEFCNFSTKQFSENHFESKSKFLRIWKSIFLEPAFPKFPTFPAGQWQVSLNLFPPTSLLPSKIFEIIHALFGARGPP